MFAVEQAEGREDCDHDRAVNKEQGPRPHRNTLLPSHRNIKMRPEVWIRLGHDVGTTAPAARKPTNARTHSMELFHPNSDSNTETAC